ncbi:hypothetical protein DSUL_20457 [Desulfovibrionales bacterium]
MRTVNFWLLEAAFCGCLILSPYLEAKQGMLFTLDIKKDQTLHTTDSI